MDPPTSAPEPDPVAPATVPPKRRWITVKGLLIEAGTVTCAATLLGFGGRLHWCADLFSHFRVQYLIGLLVLTAVMAAYRLRRLAIVFTLFAAVNLAVIVPLFLPASASRTGDGETLRLLLLNVNRQSGDPERVAALICDVEPDLIALEEIDEAWVTALEPVLRDYPAAHVRPLNHNFGIGLFSKREFADVRTAYFGSAGLPSVEGTIAVGNQTLTIIATHPPPPAGAMLSQYRNEQLTAIGDHVATQSGPVLLVGDLNISPWSPHFRDLLTRSGLRDASQGRGVQTTWPSFLLPLRIPLDHCLHTDDIVITQKRIGPAVGSDHLPVIVEFCIR